MYPVPPPNLVHLADNPAGDARLRARDAQLKARDWTNTDPGRGPSLGWGAGSPTPGGR